MTPFAQIVPEESSVLAAAAQARTAGQHLLCNGLQTCISPVVLPGWSKLCVVIKPGRQTIPKDGRSCAA